jgi:hypothetical protein
MKRLTYISKCSYAISSEEIDSITAVSIKNNQKRDLNGVLLYAHGMFFQVLEGKKRSWMKSMKK